MTLDFLDYQKRKRIKRNLLGLCGTETIRSIREITIAMMPPNYSGYIARVEEDVRESINLGTIHYKGNRYLFFTKFNDGGPSERYRIILKKK